MVNPKLHEESDESNSARYKVAIFKTAPMKIKNSLDENVFCKRLCVLFPKQLLLKSFDNNASFRTASKLVCLSNIKIKTLRNKHNIDN
jgi:hypothetical protein